jgi:putative ABC transport system substrate-binding protein
MRTQAQLSRRGACLGAAAAAVALAWRSAGAAMQRIGFISAGSAVDAANFLAALRADLARRGYAEPDALAFDVRYAEGDLALVPKLVGELERAGVTLIVTQGVGTTLVVKTPRRIPVIYEFSADPVSAGIASDLAHPGFNATGVTLMLAELNGKRLQLAKELVPTLRRVGVIANPLHPGQELERAVVDAEARKLGLTTLAFATRSEPELEASLQSLAAARVDALLVLSDGFVVAHRHQILDFALERRVPAISGWAVMAESGALCTYGPRVTDAFSRVGYFVDRVLKGAAPADLPIEQPTIVELVINLSTAQRLGIRVPASLLGRADRVIE